MTQEFLEPIDINNLSEAQLLEALRKKQNTKAQNREAYKNLVNETVPAVLLDLAVLSEQLSEAKKRTFEYFENVLKLKNEAYDIKEKQRSHTFSTETAEIVIGYRINDGWDDTVTAGVEKVRTFISSLAKDENSSALVDTIFDLLKKDAKGNLKGSRVLELQKLTEKFDNAEFTDGVKIISDAYKPIRSSWFVEAYIIKNGEKTSVPLSMSAADFPAGYSFDFFNRNDEPKTDKQTLNTCENAI